MDKFQSNKLKTSESDAAFHQIMKTSCLLNELHQTKQEPEQNINANNPFVNSSNLEFLLNIFANTNIFPDILKLESLNNNFCANPLRMLSFLADNQKEISSTLYNTVMANKNQELETNFPTDFTNHSHFLPRKKTQNYSNFNLKKNSNFLETKDVYFNFV